MTIAAGEEEQSPVGKFMDRRPGNGIPLRSTLRADRSARLPDLSW